MKLQRTRRKHEQGPPEEAVEVQSSSNESFLAYGPSHWAALSMLAIAAAVLIVRGRQIRGTPLERRFSRQLGAGLLLINLGLQTYAMLPHVWTVGESLPFQLCDLAWMAAVIALWTGRRWACGFVYYWGLTLTSQALFTPRLGVDFPSLEFLMFFISHGLTVLAAVYLTWGTGAARPTWRLWGVTSLATLAWGVLMLGFNTWAGANYLYVNRKPENRSILDGFGEWPYYLFIEAAVGLTVWALITWPWYWRKNKRLVQS